MAFSRKRIKTPERGLLALHPFIDVLEGRSLFTATAYDAALNIQQFIDAPTSTYAISPWSNDTIPEASSSADEPCVALAKQTTPYQFELHHGTSEAAFSKSAIDNTPWALFGNALHDRRGRFESHPIPSDAEIAAARERTANDETPNFATRRAMTGAMAPFLTMSVSQQNHPFA